jgi:hypothetical protein
MREIKVIKVRETERSSMNLARIRSTHLRRLIYSLEYLKCGLELQLALRYQRLCVKVGPLL